MATILVVQHHPAEHTGRLGMTLRDHGFRLDHRHVYRGAGEPEADLPASLDGYAGIISMGGPQNVGESHHWMDQELALLREGHESHKPVLGICLGAQLIAHALGGEVGAMEGGPEAGLSPVSIQVPGQTDRVLAGLRWDHPQFHLHNRAITKAPAGAQVMVSSDRAKVQCFFAGVRTYAFQYHFECDRPMIDEFSRVHRADFDAAGVSTDDLHRQCDEHYADYARLGDRLCVNIASFMFAFDELLSAH